MTGLYDPRFERDACGIGFVADLSGTPSRRIVDAALEGLRGVKHRGAVASDARSGDGAGVLLPLAGGFFARFADREVAPDRLGVAMCFLESGDDAEADRERSAARKAVEHALTESGLQPAGWREVPTDVDALGEVAKRGMPHVSQALFTHDGAVAPAAAERRAYLARRRAEQTCADQGLRAYFASFSFRTVTYKAMSAADQLSAFYPDLEERDVVGWFAIFHQRYSTNTTPTWERAQPFRFLCHNGEINTVDGNANLMRARAGRLGATWEELGNDGERLLEPLLDPLASDSAKMDAALELLVQGGRDVTHAMAMLVPQVWEGRRDLHPEVRDFYRYHAALIEPWDGPAGLVFTDGLRVAAALDRNGLRPLRYAVCDDGTIVCASEVGAVRTAGRGSVRRSRLGPGQMLLVDPSAERPLLEDAQLKRRLASRRPYGEWVRTHQRRVSPGQPVGSAAPDLLARQVVAGYTKEEETTVLRPMANDGKEPVSSMGDDTALAVLAHRRRTVYHYLRQRFAQVTNPPIDHLREWQVMSLRTQLGPRMPVLSEAPEAARLLELDGFIMYPQGLQDLVLSPQIPFQVAGLDATFTVADGPAALAARLATIADEAVAAVRDGAGLLIVSDRSVDSDRAPVPAVLAVGAVHHRLVAAGLRTQTSIISETDDARDTHTFAALLGYGAEVVCPRLALESIAELADNGRLGRDAASAGEAQEAYRHAVADGVLKIMSKMGIATLDSYRSAQIFEAVGLGADVIDAALVGTPSNIGGVSLEALGADVLARHAEAFAAADDQAAAPKLDSPGFFKFKKGGEYHAVSPDVVSALHHAVGLEGDLPPLQRDSHDLQAAHLLTRATKEGRWEHYQRFAALLNDREPAAIRDLVEPIAAADRNQTAVPLEQVEPATSIVQRFFTGAMSLGALSPEAHETLAEAMNLLGGMSNCGEGGEDPARFASRGTSRDRNSRAKQVASGRFGVTPTYLAYADEIQIKMAQGSKPGEGGQLPGHKVSDMIARLRHTQPGVALISPPPHHDIYSIEDLAQLIYDLKQVNPFASVGVKLVSSAGVGTIAAGVAKGLADAVQIAGSDGGTGASSLSSIKHAGLPWELGLADAQQTLVANGLRARVRLQVDGGFRTGRDVLIAALLGADEYGFGTAALLAEGCIMVRACHRDTCPVGVATQRPELRDKFRGTPEMVAAYLLFVAEEVRHGLAAIGLRSMDEAIGRVELLAARPVGAGFGDIDVTPLLAVPEDPAAARAYEGAQAIQSPRGVLGDRVFDDAFESLWDGTVLNLKYDIRNADRTVGARLGGAIGLEFGEVTDGGGTPIGSVSVRFNGEAGQSFGAFLSPGVEFVLTGEANDYVGKGMAGGRIVIRPPADDAGDPVLLGNTVLYGATGGELFVAGRAGERFAVRNSGAWAVVEGVGDHACEYMTGGVVIVLGQTGTNVGAGMTGGECYVLDATSSILARVNSQLVEAQRPDGPQLARLRALIARHVELTGSTRGATLLERWDGAADAFWRIAPRGELARIESVHEGSVGAPV